MFGLFVIIQLSFKNDLDTLLRKIGHLFILSSGHTDSLTIFGVSAD